MRRNEALIEVAICVSLLISLATVWYFGWVQPRTEYLHAVMDCMTEIGDHTEKGYNICADRISS